MESPLTVRTKARPKFPKTLPMARRERSEEGEKAEWRDGDDGERSPSAEMAEPSQAMKGETPIIQKLPHC